MFFATNVGPIMDQHVFFSSFVMTCFEFPPTFVSKGPKGFKIKPLNGAEYFPKPILNNTFFPRHNASKIIPKNHNLGKMQSKCRCKQKEARTYKHMENVHQHFCNIKLHTCFMVLLSLPCEGFVVESKNTR